MVLFEGKKTAGFKVEMYSTLLYPHHVRSDNKKLIEFKDDEHGEALRPVAGFTALRGDKLYLLKGDRVKKDMPIKIVSEELPIQVTKTGDVIHIVPYNTPGEEYYRSFKITPDKMMSYSELLDCADQKHSCGHEFIRNYGNILYAAMCSRINVCLAGNVGSSKSSYYDNLDNIYDCGPRVEKPASAASLAKGVSTEGVLLIDELTGLKTKEAKIGVETVINSLASMSNQISYGTAGSKAYGTMNPPPTDNLSCVIVYNLFGTKEDCSLNVKDSPFKPSYWKQKDYFDWMWDNQASVVDRFLRFKMPNGKLDVAQFLNNGVLSEDEKTTLKKMAKTKAYFTEVARVGFTKGVCGYPAELSEDDVQYILKYIFNTLKIGKDSRYLNSLLEILKFGMVSSKPEGSNTPDYAKFSVMANEYKSWIDDYAHMVDLNKDRNWEIDNGLQADTTPSIPKVPELPVNGVKIECADMRKAYDESEVPQQMSLEDIEEMIL